MRGFFIVTSVFFVLHLVFTDVQARPDQSMAMTTEASKSNAMSSNSTSNDLGSEETVESDESLENDDNDTEGEADSQMPSTCTSRPPEIVNIEMQCMAEYKAMKKAKCNATEDENIGEKKVNTMESLESEMERHKRETGMGEEGMNSTESMNITKAGVNVHHRKRSCHYYQCILKKLNVLDESVMMPNEEMFKTWVSSNLTNEDEKKQLHETVVECFAELHESGFYDTKADHNTNMSKTEEASVEGMKKAISKWKLYVMFRWSNSWNIFHTESGFLISPSYEKSEPSKGKPSCVLQWIHHKLHIACRKTSCNAALKLLKCLSKQKNECPAFSFP